jgi:hypothetical protein
MIGILFHGPEVFDRGWARRIIDVLSALDDVRCVLAGAMGRTAVIDSGLPDIECPGKQPSRILKELEGTVDWLVFANYAKSEISGLTHGSMIVERAGVKAPLLQIECSGRCFVEWIEGNPPETIAALHAMGLRRELPIARKAALWEENGRICRRLSTAAPGEFLLVDGIVIGQARGGEITIECEGRHIIAVRGADIKAHGIEKLDRLGGVDLRSAKVASATSLRRGTRIPRTSKTSGKGVVFVDHAGMHVYDLIRDREGAVTVGDDTTAVVGDVLYRFQIPLIGITDGDRDDILGETFLTPGSTVYTVHADDIAGLRIHAEIFRRQPVSEDPFEVVRARITDLLGKDILRKQDF